MQTEEQQLINGLFDRLKQAETQTANRDSQAEQLIQQRLREQPAAPYYMSQVILIQEATLKRLDQKVRELEAQLQQNRPSSGGFLSNLFGGGAAQPAPSRPAPVPTNRGGWNEPGPQQGAPSNNWGGSPAPSRAGGFLAGAMQTAVGVAGGMMLANTISGLFHNSAPEEIVNVINEQPTPPPSVADAPAEQPSGGWSDPSSDDQYTNSDHDFGGSSDDGSFFDDSDDDSLV